MGKPTHIELFGLPGSGKTTVAEQAATRHAGRIYTLRDGYKLWLRWSAAPSRFETVYKRIPTELIDWVLYFGTVDRDSSYDETTYRECATELIKEYTEDSQRSTIVREWVTQLQTRYATAMSSVDRTQIVLLDEGFLQRGNAIFCPPTASKEISYEDVKRYMETIPTPDLIVLLDISVTESEKRINRRDDGPPRSFSGQERSAVLDRLHRMMVFIDHVRSAAHELGIPVVCIENEGPVEDAITTLDEHLNGML